MATSIVIPAYNEEKRIGPFLAAITRHQARHPADIREVIVVNDGSTDRTAATVQSFQQRLPQLKLISHPKNRGKGAAVQTGIMAAKSPLIVFMDADGATDIDQLPKMIHALEKTPIAIGNRWMPGASTQRHSSVRRLAGWIYRTYMKLFGLGDTDTMCGFKGYRRDVARQLFSSITETGWLFDTEIAYKARRRGIPITNLPIRWQSKEGSKLSAKTLLVSAIRILPLIRRINRNYPHGSHSKPPLEKD